MRISVAYAILVVFALLLVLGSIPIPVAHAQTDLVITTANGATVCPSTPLSGSWSGTTCSSTNGISIPSGTTLDIDSGVTITDSAGIDNHGTINNAGTMTGSAPEDNVGGIQNENGGTIINTGTMSGTSNGNGIGILNYGTINNTGNMSGSNGGGGGYGIANYGTTNNAGTMSGSGYSGPAIYNAVVFNGVTTTGIINNTGSMTGSAYCALYVIENYGGGTINNAGSMSGSAQLPACSYAGIYNDGGSNTIINNYGTMDGSGYYGVNDSGILNNYGIIIGSGDGSTGYEGIGIDSGDVINNGGNMNGTGYIGIQTEPGDIINNAGTMNGVGGYDGIQNYGTINNAGSVSGVGSSNRGIENQNNDVITDYCGVTLQGSYEGSAPSTVSCYTVTFDESGMPSGATWGVKVSWGLFPAVNHTGTGASISVNAVGTLAYSYENTTNSGTTSECVDACSGSATISGSMIFYSEFYALTTSITTSNGAAACSAFPIYGTWSSASDTCTLSGVAPLNIVAYNTLDIGAGVTVTVNTNSGWDIYSYGAVNNAGTMIGNAYGTGIQNSGTINNTGTISGTGDNYGIENYGVINNAGSMTGSSTIGIENYYPGIINNDGNMTGRSIYGSGSPGFVNYEGTVNNAGTMIGSSYLGTSQIGTDNYGTLNDYCGESPSGGSYTGNSPSTISCHTVTFQENNLGTGTAWGVTTSWSPTSGVTFLSFDHTGTGASIPVSVTGSLTYSYESPIAGSAAIYNCNSGCSGSATISGNTAFTASYVTLLSVSLSFTPNGQNDWFTTATAEGTVSATSSVNTISSFSCTVDGSSVALSGYTGLGTASASATVAVTGQSTGHSVSCTTTDNIGETTSAATATVKIETTPPEAPTVTLSPGSPNGHNGWYTGSVSALVTPSSETISGGVTCTQPSPATTDGEGLTLSSTCTDNAGLSGSAGTSSTFDLEVSPPIVTIVLATSPGIGGWYTGAVTFDASGTSQSGSVICTPIGAYSGPSSFSASVSTSCTDAAGLSGTGTSPTFKFEETGPLAPSVGPTTSPNTNGWYATSVSFIALPPPATFSGTVTCTTPPAYTSPSSATATSEVSDCTDPAGLTSSAASAPFQFEATSDGPQPPIVSISSTSMSNGGVYIGSVSFVVTPPPESFSGGVNCQIPSYSGPDGQGLTVSSACIDYAGLTSGGSSPTFSFEAIGPSVSVAPSTIESGQTATLTPLVSDGSGSYSSYAFYIGSTCDSSAVQSSSSNSYSSVLTSTTTFCVSVTDSFGATAETNVTVTVTAAVSSGSLNSATILVGHDATFSISPSGGFTPYTYTWILPSGSTITSGCGTGDSSCTLSENSPGVYSVSVTVTDNVGVTSSTSAAMDVQTPTTTTLSCATPITVGASDSCTLTVSNNETSYSSLAGGTVVFSNAPPGFRSSCTLSVSAICFLAWTPTSAGTYTITSAYTPTPLSNETHAASSGQISVIVQAGASSSSVVCSPNPLTIGLSSTCAVTVSSAGGTTVDGETVTLSETTGSGSVSFSGGMTCTLSGSICSINNVLGTTLGSIIIEASYPGDSNNLGSSGMFNLTVTSEQPTTTSISCGSPLPVRSFTTCTATVTGSASPTGNVSFSGGAFTPTFCTLSSGSCSVSYQDTTTGTPSVTASYDGDSNNLPSSGSFSITVQASVVITTCSATSVTNGSQVFCRAGLIGYYFDPSNPDEPAGIINWTSNSPTGLFSHSSTGPFSSSITCSLTSGVNLACPVYYSDSTVGAPVITASYYFFSSSYILSTSSFIIGNFATLPSSAQSYDEVLGGSGTGLVNQTAQTGVFTSIFGSNAGTAATVFSADLGTMQPTGIATISLGNPQYYYVEVNGNATGTAQECITTANQLSYQYTVEYWDGSQWVAATSLNVSGSQICGDIPVSALTGTNIALGLILPTATISLTPNGQNGWFTTTTAVVTISATSSYGTISSISCTIDGLSATLGGLTGLGTAMASATVSVTGESAGHTVSCTATDNNGDSSNVATATVKIETTGPGAPIVAFSPGSPNGLNGWYTGSVSFTVNPPTNTISGAVTCSPVPDYTNPSSTSALSQVSVCTDPAGLTNSAASASFKFEATTDGPGVPTISLSSTSTDNGVYIGSVSFIVIPPAETFSGVVSCTPISSYSGPNGQGLTFSSTCADNAGLTSTTNSQAFSFEITAPTVSVSPSTIDSGQTATLTAIASGGSSSFSDYAFYSGSTCSGSFTQSNSANSYSAVLTSTTTYCVKVTDSFGATAQTTVTITVSAGVSTGLISPASTTVLVGQTTTFSISPTGGTSPYTYSWTLPSGSTVTSGCGAGNASCSFSDNSPGVYSVSVTVTDFVGGTSSTSATLNVQTSTTTTLTCLTPITAGSSDSCTVTVSNNDVSYSTSALGTITFSGAPGGFPAICTLASGTCAITWTPTSAGSFTITSSYSASVSDTTHAASSSQAGVTVQEATSSSSVTCSPNPVTIGLPATCTVTITGTGSSISGETVSWSQTTGSGSAAFTAGTTCTLSGSSCSLNVDGASLGTTTIKASYLGDSNNVGSSNTFSLTVRNPSTTTTVSCAANLPAGSTTTCIATVASGLPTGTISFGATAGTFTPTSCSLNSGSCSVSFKDTSVGSPTITATYAGDSHNLGSSGTITITVTTGVLVNCSPSTVTANSSTTCTVTVLGSSPTGSVTWSSSSTTGLFNSSGSCTLSSGTCSLKYSDSTVGAPVITATYSGVSGSFILANFVAPAAATESAQTTLTGGSGSMNLTQTGVALTISNSTGSSATLFSADLGSKPSGTPSVSLGNAGYYDVKVSGVTGGIADVCFSNSNVDASTILQYYSGGNWVSATGITRVIGAKICGNMPVSALTGTYFTEGDPLVSVGPPATIVYGNVTWYTPTYQGSEYIYSASVSINGRQFSATFYETLFAQYQLTPGSPYAGFYGSTFGAISGCQQGSTITLTVTVDSVTKSNSGICPVPGNSTAINLNFTTSSSGSTSAIPISSILAWPISVESFLVVISAWAVICMGGTASWKRCRHEGLNQKKGSYIKLGLQACASLAGALASIIERADTQPVR